MDEKFEAFVDKVIQNSKVPNLRMDSWQREILSKLREYHQTRKVNHDDQMDAFAHFYYFGRGNAKRRPPMEISAPLLEKEENLGRYHIEVTLDPSTGIYTIFVRDRILNIARQRLITQKDLAFGRDEDFFKKLVGEHIDDCIRELKEIQNGQER